jgi:hypothetical protein
MLWITIAKKIMVIFNDTFTIVDGQCRFHLYGNYELD